MMKSHFTITLLLIIFSSCNSENVDDKSKQNDEWAWWVDDETEKGSWIPVTNNNSSVENGKYTLFYFNGNIAEKGRMKSKKKVDTTFYFGLLGSADGYELNLSDTDKIFYYKDGNYKFFYLDGTLNGSGIIKDHRRGDKWKIYYKNGKLKYNKDLKNGVGFVSGYFENGHPEFIEYWNDSTQNCWIVKEWYENGKLKEENNFQNGYSSGICKEYHENGNLKKVYFIKNGKVNGALKTFFKKGTIEQIENKKDGKANGHISSWYENGNMRLEGNMKEGEWDGLQKYYYSNGQLMGTVEIKSGIKHGELIKFDSLGKLLSKEFYQDGIRIK